MSMHLQLVPAFVSCVNTCFYLWYLYYTLVIKPKRLTVGLEGAQFFNKFEAEL